jgi:O-antigen/teichoic acid export membrane protein
LLGEVYLTLARRGSFILIGGQLLSTLISVLGAILVARFLGSTSYGQIAIALVPVSIASILSDLGINSALIKYSVLSTEKKRLLPAAKLTEYYGAETIAFKAQKIDL